MKAWENNQWEAAVMAPQNIFIYVKSKSWSILFLTNMINFIIEGIIMYNTFIQKHLFITNKVINNMVAAHHTLIVFCFLYITTAIIIWALYFDAGIKLHDFFFFILTVKMSN